MVPWLTVARLEQREIVRMFRSLRAVLICLQCDGGVRSDEYGNFRSLPRNNDFLNLIAGIS